MQDLIELNSCHLEGDSRSFFKVFADGGQGFNLLLEGLQLGPICKEILSSHVVEV